MTAAAIPAHHVLVRRLRKHYAAASVGERREGECWYDEASDVARALSAASPYSVEQCAYTIAALSPRAAWPENVAAATIAVDMHARGMRHDAWPGCGTDVNKAKAARILAGDLDALSGPKVTAFARAILGDPDAVTVDVWMQRACGMASAAAPTAREFRAIDAALRAAAYADDVAPRDYQAVVWVRVRNETLRSMAPRYARLVSDAGRGSEGF